MRSPKLLLYATIVTAQMCAALAPSKIVNSQYNPEGLESQIESGGDEQLNKRQDKPSKIGISVYSEKDCNGYLGTADDLTQSIGEPWLPFPNGDGVAYSFKLLYRDLQGQEQLDIYTKNPINGEPCGDFIVSYFAGTSTSCNNWGNIGCVMFWNNRGL